MAKLRNFYGFSRIVENELSYNDLLREFPEFNLIMNTEMGVITTLSPLTDNQVTSDNIVSRLNKISGSPLLQKTKELESFIGEIIPKINLGESYSDVTDKVKDIAEKVYTEVKNLNTKYDKLLDLNPDTEIQKDIDNLISLWCQVNIKIIEKNKEISESIILEKNMIDVFGEDLVSIKVKIRSLLSDIDTYLKNKNVRTSSRLRDIKNKASQILDEITDGVGYGQNWNNFSRGDAKKRISTLNTLVNDLTSKYTEVVFSEKDFSDEYNKLVSEINAICSKINSLLKKISEESMNAQEGMGGISGINDLAWGIIDPEPTSEKKEIIGLYKKRKWVKVSPGSGGTFETFGTGGTLYDQTDPSLGFLYKEQSGSIKRDDSTWYETPEKGSGWDDPNWTEVKDSAKIDFFNKCLQYSLVQKKKWVCENSKSLWDKDGSPVYTPTDAEKFSPTEEEIKAFDPDKSLSDLKKFPNYENNYYADSLELIPDGGGSGGGGGGGGGSTSSDPKENYYHTSQINEIRFKGTKGISYYNNLPNQIDGGPNRTWYRGSELLKTKWFKPGSFPEAPSDWWMRVNNGIWEACPKGSTSQPKDGVDDIRSLNNPLERSLITSAVSVINNANQLLSEKIKEQNQINKYWGMGSGKTNVSSYPWGYNNGMMKVEKAGTSDERCGGEISPSAWGASSINDDVIIYYYKNGNFEIGDDDYEDRIWGSWGIDSDNDEFYIKWDLYATSSSGGWRSIKPGVGRVGETTMFTCPINDGLKGALDKAAKRFIEVFY
jgi:hypothetical protein